MPGLAYNGVARLGPRAMVRPGDRVTFRVDASRLHLFDPTLDAPGEMRRTQPGRFGASARGYRPGPRAG